MGVSTALIWGGIWIISCGWQLIHKAQGKPLVVEGIYSRVRHPQYLGLFMIIIGLLIQWPTIISLVMAPILFWSYVRLARREEREMVAQFGEVYQICRETVPAFVPRRPGIASASFHDTQEDVST